jgi:hypothetical protein
MIVDAEPLGIFRDDLHAHVIGEPHRHQIARALDASPQCRGSSSLAVIILR